MIRHSLSRALAYQARRGYPMLLIGGIGVAAACTDAPSAPKSPLNKMVPAVAQDVSYQNGSQLIVVDQSGLTLALDVPAQEVRYSDGRVVLLTADQTVQVASDFHNTIVYDQLANEVQTQTAGPLLCGGEISCDEPMSRGLPNPQIFRSNAPPRGRAGAFYGKAGRFRTQIKPGRGVTVPSPHFDYIVLPDCQSLKTSVLVSMAAYRNDRANTYARWRDIALESFAVEGGRLVLHLSTPIGVGIAAGVAADYANKLASSIQMDVMRVAYTSQGCGTINWAGASSGGAVGALPLVCHNESWHISFDYGQTWRTVDAQVCEFAVQ